MDESFICILGNNCLFNYATGPLSANHAPQKIKPATLACGGFGSPLALPATDFFGDARA
jgi:hypothetical protein